MLDSIMQIISPLLQLLSNQFGIVGTILGILFMFVFPIASVLIEIIEVITTLTVSTKDDETAKMLRAKYEGIIKALEFLPHVNLPLAPALLKIISYAGKLLAAVKGAIAAWKS